ncbi:hypothetical protein KSP35_20215 [Aquihabitans sp. G128]|uniref:hypothetical protein n=1 Tax=Aquihabitans sp. G128 TaxID=2849779 RepID=UPI001C21182A|nr:hypothetical protein [Aquihabitans sp. G128]QXC60620.1 hypothetical protein KSP35_20215 [Aquihabitans sp. G128]
MEPALELCDDRSWVCLDVFAPDDQIDLRFDDQDPKFCGLGWEPDGGQTKTAEPSHRSGSILATDGASPIEQHLCEVTSCIASVPVDLPIDLHGKPVTVGVFNDLAAAIQDGQPLIAANHDLAGFRDRPVEPTLVILVRVRDA